MARGVAAALDYAHQRDVVHRDIKPDNILFHDDHPLVADYGIALALGNRDGERMTKSGLLIGTPTYMSPEQITGAAVDGGTDRYALACVVFECLTGSPALPGAQCDGRGHQARDRAHPGGSPGHVRRTQTGERRVPVGVGQGAG